MIREMMGAAHAIYVLRGHDYFYRSLHGFVRRALGMKKPKEADTPNHGLGLEF